MQREKWRQRTIIMGYNYDQLQMMNLSLTVFSSWFWFLKLVSTLCPEFLEIPLYPSS